MNFGYFPVRIMPLMSAGIFWIFSLAAFAQEKPDVTTAEAALNAVSKQKVVWNTAKSRHADVDCDHRPDTILFGSSEGTVWVGMVPGGANKPHVLAFPIASGVQNGFPARPTRIGVYPLICDTESVGRLDGCKPSRQCKGFDLDAGETDPFNFYWDAEHKRLGWWRN